MLIVLRFIKSDNPFSELSVFDIGAAAVAVSCNFYTAYVYFNKIKIYLNDIDHNVNLDIWGVLKQGQEDIDVLKRFIKRAPKTILHTKGLLFIISNYIPFHVITLKLLCVLRGWNKYINGSSKNW